MSEKNIYQDLQQLGGHSTLPNSPDEAVLESEGSQSTAEGINDGIMFLMAVPYILVGTIGFFIYRKYNKPQKSESADETV